ncbi:MAG: hypothetical protein WA708_01860 [Acidobacteriaceae bacterium]
MTAVERALVDAIAAALPILSADRDVLLDSEARKDSDGKPDRAPLDAGALAECMEYDLAIRLCEQALRLAGVR